MIALENWYAIAQMKNKRNLDSLESLIGNADNPKPFENLRELILSDTGFKIYQEIDRIKVELSNKDESRIKFTGLSFEIDEKITRKEFEKMIETQLQQTKELLDEVINFAKMNMEDIDSVITTGGSSNIPVFKKLLTDYFMPEKVQFGESFISVASGLALRSQELFGYNE